MGIYNTSAGSLSTIMGHQVDSLGWGFVTQRMLMQFRAMNSQLKLFSSQELTQEKTQFFNQLLLPRPRLTKARHFPAPHSHLIQTWSLVPCTICLLLLNVQIGIIFEMIQQLQRVAADSVSCHLTIFHVSLVHANCKVL